MGKRYQSLIGAGVVGAATLIGGPAQAQSDDDLHQALYSAKGTLVGCAVVAKVEDKYKPVVGPYTGPDGKDTVGSMYGALPEATKFCAQGTPQAYSAPTRTVDDQAVSLTLRDGSEWHGRAIVTGKTWTGPQ